MAAQYSKDPRINKLGLFGGYMYACWITDSMLRDHHDQDSKPEMIECKDKQMECVFV